MRQPYDLDGQTHYSAASIGITRFDPQPVRVEELMKQGDMAMYRAKAAGRNTMSLDTESHPPSRCAG